MKKILKYVGVVMLMMIGVLCTGCTKSMDNEGKTDALKPYQVSELIVLSRWYYNQRNGFSFIPYDFNGYKKSDFVQVFCLKY